MIQINLDVMMAKRKMSLNELAQRMDLSLANLSILKNNKCRAIRFSTLNTLCNVLDCQVGDLMEYISDEQEA
ncbi:MAG: helix-turn-helix transcriptional regulator [Clostridia bacterium]